MSRAPRRFGGGRVGSARRLRGHRRGRLLQIGEGNHLLAFRVAAAFGEHLVLDVDARDTRFEQALQDARGIERVTAAGIDIGHHRDAHGARDVAGEIEDIFLIPSSDDLAIVPQTELNGGSLPSDIGLQGNQFLPACVSR
jgi:hypothetical protein